MTKKTTTPIHDVLCHMRDLNNSGCTDRRKYKRAARILRSLLRGPNVPHPKAAVWERMLRRQVNAARRFK